MGQPAPPTLQQWDKQFLKDINAPYTAQNVNFLDAWVGREGGMQTKGYNPLFTTQQGPGSVAVNSVGVQAFPTLAGGAQADATALMNGLYNNILQGFRSNTLNAASGNYSNELSKWSGGGYNSLAGVTPQNPFAQFGPFMGGGSPNANQLTGNAALFAQQNQPVLAQAMQQQQMDQIAEQQMLQWIQEQSKGAKQEAGFQRADLLLSQADLQAQQAALRRQMGLAPEQQAIQEKEYHQQFADMIRNYNTNKSQQQAQEASGGSFFSKGSRDDRMNLLKGYQSSHNMLALQKQSEELNYREQINAMKDQQAALNRMAQRYGISVQEIQSRLAQQLSNIQYGGLTSMYPLQQDILNSATQAALASGIFAPQQPSATKTTKVKKKPPPANLNKRRGGVS